LGGVGNDKLNGGLAADTMTGGVGDDTYYVDDAGDLIIENPGEGTDIVYSSISYTLADNVEKLILTGTGDTSGTGNALANTIRGTTGSNVIDGGDGNDNLYGAAGNDTVNGGNGIDMLDGGLGADTMAGGAGNDTYYVDNVGDTVIENLGEGTEVVYSSVSFTLGANVEKLLLTGTGAIDGTGNSLVNVIRGNEAANVISGGAGNDTLYGNGGNDTLIGGAGTDHLTGGSGNDLFVFGDGEFGGSTTATADEIVDFTSGQDTIDLSAVDANTLLGGDQAFAFIGTNAFSNTAGELRYEQISGNTYLTGDTNGDGLADFMIKVDGSHAFTSGDFEI
jgi:Ca2+-binding RTX toxin-like protein